jgi:hypothetical protein
VSFEVLIKEQPLQSKPLGLAITTAAFLPNTSKAPFNTERLVEPTSFRIISAYMPTTQMMSTLSQEQLS